MLLTRQGLCDAYYTSFRVGMLSIKEQECRQPTNLLLCDGAAAV